MAYQMVYTSMRSGLVVGRSGFCTAARHREISEALVGRIEELSAQYDRGTHSTRGGAVLPVIFSHRIFPIRGREWHVLMRLGDAGNDYSGRTNHIAHAVVLDAGEIARLRISPAEAMLHLAREGRWLDRYEEGARYFEQNEVLKFQDCPPQVDLPARHWEQQTGAAACAALPLAPAAVSGAGIVVMAGNDPTTLLALFAESLLVASPDRSDAAALWSRSFTTLLQSIEQRADYDWYGCSAQSPPHLQLAKAGRYLIELNSSLAPPVGRWAEIAEGKSPAATRKPKRLEEGAKDDADPVPWRSREAAGAAAPVAATVMPKANLLGPTTTKPRRTGLPWWGKALAGLVVLGLVAAIGVLPRLANPAAKATAELETTLAAGRWADALSLLGKLRTEGDALQRCRESPAFRVAEGLAGLARDYEWIARHDPESAPQGEGVRDATEFLKKLAQTEEGLAAEARAKQVPWAPPPALAQLKDTAAARVGQYQALRKEAETLWAEMATLAPPKAKVPEWRSRLDEVGASKEGSLGTQFAQAEEAAAVVGEFHALKNRSLPDEAAVEQAEKARDGLAARLSKVVDAPAGRSWQKPALAIYKGILAFEPKAVEPEAPPPPPVAKAPPPEMKPPPKIEKPALRDLGIPPAYFRKQRDDRIYSYADVPELRMGLPKHLCLIAGQTYDSGKAQLGEHYINQQIYFQGSARYEGVLDVDDEQKQLAGERLPEEFGNGFILGFGAPGKVKPDFLFVVQRPSLEEEDAVEAPFFVTLAPDLTLSRGEGDEVVLSPEAVKLLGDLRYAEPVSEYQLLRSRGSGAIVLATAKAPGELRGSLLRSLDQRIAEQEALIAAQPERARNRESFDLLFASLGRSLFCGEGTEPLLYGLEVEKNTRTSPVTLTLVAKPDGRLEPKPPLIQTLAEYRPPAKPKAGPVVIEYVNVHLADVFLQGLERLRDPPLTEGDRRFLEDRTVFVSHKEWGPEEIKKVVAGWGEITAESQKKKWATPPKPPGLIPPEDRIEHKAQDVQRRASPGYRSARFVSDFFTVWERVFTTENLVLMEAVLAKDGGQPVEKLETLQAELMALKEDREQQAGQSLGELGTFYVTGRVGPDLFRLIRVEGGSKKN